MPPHPDTPPDPSPSPDVPTSIEGVVDALDRIVERAADGGGREGYFAAVYRTVTATVRDGLDDGTFDDPERMERLDVAFAARYLRAADARRRGRPTTEAWRVAFDAAQRWRPIVLQHLVVGINAHINLDLGIATARTAGDAHSLPALRRDFDRINGILAAVMDRVKGRLGRISPWIGLLDAAGGITDDTLVRFSIEVARARAWQFATELAPLDRDAWGPPIDARDAAVARLGRTVLRPGLLSVPLLAVRLRESDDVTANLHELGAVRRPDPGVGG